MKTQRYRDTEFNTRYLCRPGSDSLCGCSKPQFPQFKIPNDTRLRFVGEIEWRVSCKVAIVEPVILQVLKGLWEVIQGDDGMGRGGGGFSLTMGQGGPGSGLG